MDSLKYHYRFGKIVPDSGRVQGGRDLYELVHDRFIDPILQANAEWQQDHPLIIAARQLAKDRLGTKANYIRVSR